MQNSFLLSLLTGAITGAAAAVVTTLVIAPATPAREVLVIDQEESSVPVAGLLEELAVLRAENADLALRVSTLELQPATVPATRWPVISDELPAALALQAEGSDDPLLVASEVPVTREFRNRVEEAVQSIRKEETRERDLARAMAREERMETRLTDLTEKLSLDKYQAGEMRVALTTQDERRSELFETMWETGDRRGIREGMREIAEETWTTLERVLTPGQLEGYREYSQAQRGGDDPNGARRRNRNAGSDDGGTSRGRR